MTLGYPHLLARKSRNWPWGPLGLLRASGHVGCFTRLAARFDILTSLNLFHSLVCQLWVTADRGVVCHVYPVYNHIGQWYWILYDSMLDGTPNCSVRNRNLLYRAIFVSHPVVKSQWFSLKIRLKSNLLNECLMYWFYQTVSESHRHTLTIPPFVLLTSPFWTVT